MWDTCWYSLSSNILALLNILVCDKDVKRSTQIYPVYHNYIDYIAAVMYSTQALLFTLFQNDAAYKHTVAVCICHGWGC